jgi:hypothetical protein
MLGAGGGFGKRDDRRHKINIPLKCATVGTRICGRSVPPPPDEVDRGGPHPGRNF